ncbi:hypothetical protein KRP69_01800 [Mammaliicoccus sciuri]|uniref:hypothetical protein n=1 Tax=Mammaliicoccus sciuri TaxID=1296 RepID=UPI001D0D6A6B|nr:hypothetical protein [Mammaliicoccus sciuri]MCC2087939.1 hypothetical protein [Mammaliicoccus sciuri]
MSDQKLIVECINELEELINYKKGFKEYQFQSLEDGKKSRLIVNNEQHIKAQLKGVQRKLKEIINN